MHRRKHQLDRPFGRQSLGLERIGEAEAADGEVGLGGAHPVELALEMLAFADHRFDRQQLELARERQLEELLVQLRGGGAGARLAGLAGAAATGGASARSPVLGGPPPVCAAAGGGAAWGAGWGAGEEAAGLQVSRRPSPPRHLAGGGQDSKHPSR